MKRAENFLALLTFIYALSNNVKYFMANYFFNKTLHLYLNNNFKEISFFFTLKN